MIRRWFKWFVEARWLWMNNKIASLQYYRSLILEQERYQDPKRLNRFEFQVFSQNGEDGILFEIFKRINSVNRIFVEIGVENGLENNTTFLLQQGWSGYWLEGNLEAVRFIRKHFEKPITNKVLSVRHVFAREDDIVGILSDLNVPRDPDLLSIDIDRNTYYVLKAILSYLRPRVLVVEYNSLYPPPVEWKVEYSPEKSWNRSSYVGASLKAYEILGNQFGYSVVGCDICGINAFFVRNELLNEHFLPPYTAENHYEPLRDFLIHKVGHPRRFTDSSNQFK